MIDNSCRLKPQTRKCARGARNKQVTHEEGSRAIVSKGKGPASSQTSRQPSSIVFRGRIHDPSRSVVRVGPILAHIPAWARQQSDDPTLREKIASHIAGPSRSCPPPFEPLITVSETAEIFHVSPRTIRRMIRRGNSGGEDWAVHPSSGRGNLSYSWETGMIEFIINLNLVTTHDTEPRSLCTCT